MKRWIFILTIVLLGLSACTTFHGVTVISPKVGHPNAPTKVESLQPILKWKPSSQMDVTYDVIIYEGIATREGFDIVRAWPKRAMGKEVYYREGFKETEHKVEDLLKSDNEYYWSVRVRQGEQVSEWSRYDYLLFGGVAYVKGDNLLFMFKTPKK